MSFEVADLRGAALPGAACALVGEPDRWPARLAAMTDVLLDEVARSGLLGLPQDQRALAIRLVTRLCQEYGGTREYWPKPDRIARVLRDARIWAEHDGTSDGPRGVRALARAHGVTPEQIWAILRAQRALHKKA